MTRTRRSPDVGTGATTTPDSGTARSVDVEPIFTSTRVGVTRPASRAKRTTTTPAAIPSRGVRNSNHCPIGSVNDPECHAVAGSAS
ncbi:hypothetical protein [Nocardioides alcanivorans]|uniref:hypothetical protein n=1 Tax=Nocardioides alcanivorans TaxID=2897352 RepID=UPI001F305307|nr:hypothetical protein [Nocardioides alcanivorans]